ncbi:MAG: SurA N-terminal domain-containing protein [Pseudomonadota bacterium]
MLDFFRRGVKTWVAKVLLFLLIISFAVWGIGDIFTASSGGTVAQVGDTEVEAEDFANSVRRQQLAIAQQRGELIDLATLREAGIDDAILSGMIRDAAFTEELNQLKIAIGQDAVADAIRENPAFQDGQGGFSQYAYIEVLSRQSLSTQEFEAMTRDLLGQEILVRAVTTGSGGLPGAAERIAAWQGERRAVSVVELELETAPDPGTPSAGDLQTFYDADPDRFIEPERRWGVYLHVDPAALAADAVPTDDEVRAEYDSNIDAYTAQPSRTLEQIDFPDLVTANAAMARLKDGTASYEEIAAEQNVALENLALGAVTEEELPTSSAEAVFALTEPGFAGPVETLSGAAIYNVTAVELGSVTPFEDLKDALADRIATRRAMEQVPGRATEIDEIRADGVDMEEIAARSGLELLRFGGLATDGSVAEGEAPALVRDPRFMAEVQDALDNQDRDLVQLSDGGYALVLVERIKDSYLPEVDEIKDKVTEAWSQEQRLIALEARAADLVLQSAEGGIDAVAASLETEAVDFPAYGRAQLPSVFAAAITDQIFSADNGGLVIGRSTGGQSVMVAQVTEIVPLAEDDLSQNAEAATQNIANGIAADQIELFARALEARLGAQINPGVVELVFEQLNQVGHGFGHGQNY